MYKNAKDVGRQGRNFEVTMRFVLGLLEEESLETEKMHGQGKADCIVKKGVTLECKSGCGWLVSPIYDTPYQAQKALDNGDIKMLRAMFVAYIPCYDGTNLHETRILTQKAFINIFSRFGKLRIKKSSANGKYGITIQSYIPTPTFKASQAVYQGILQALDEEGMTIEQFANKMGL